MADQCVQGQGVVQISIQIKITKDHERRINIVDVLKPAEDYLELDENGMYKYDAHTILF